MAIEREQSPIKRTVTSFEKIFSRRLAVAHAYTWRYRVMVDREVTLGDLGDCDRIVNVGCGSIPATAINLARFTAAEVVCLDYDPEAVSNARRVLGRFGVGENISVQVADGRISPMAEFDAAVVALHTVGKSAVLDNFLDTAGPQDRAVVRYPRGSLQGHYGRPDDRHRGVDSTPQIGMNLDRSVLFVGNRCPAQDASLVRDMN